jgi:Carboxypeptidase regulatory-like domain
LADSRAASKPPAPAGARVLAPGQLPHQCKEGDPPYGHYWNVDTKQWTSAPNCYAVWRNLTMTAPRLANAGQAVTFTATPTEGSNSAEYAPLMRQIKWTYSGKLVSGCGSDNLTCTFIPAAKPADWWIWAPVSVSMPRTYFIDSKGSNCQGYHVCAGFTTNAYSFVGVRPERLTPGMIRGTVVDSHGAGLPGVKVRADGAESRTATTTPDGRYELEFKRSGRVVVRASNGRAIFAPKTKAVNVRRGASSTANFRVNGCKTDGDKARAAAGARKFKATRPYNFTGTWDCEQSLEVTWSGRVKCTAGADVDVSFTWTGKTRPDGSFAFIYAPGKRIEDLEWSNVVLMSGRASKTGIDLEFSATARNSGDVGTARTCDQHAEMHLR